MPVNARLVIRDANVDGAGFLDSFYGESAGQAATERAAADNALTVHGSAVAVGDRVQQGWWFDGTDAFTADRPFTDAQTLDARRLRVVLNLLDHEDLPQLGIWGAADPTRAKGYARWVEVNTGATLVDGNFTDDTLYAKLLGESGIPKKFWYHAYDVSAWYTDEFAFYRADLTLGQSGLIHYVTIGSTTTPDSRGGVASGLALPSDPWIWQVELAKYRDGLTT